MQYQKLLEILNENSMGNWSNLLKKQNPDFFSNINHGDFSKWLNVIHDLPFVSASEFHLDLESITIGNKIDCSDEERRHIKRQLKHLMPWRKGPYNLFGLVLDAEWQSNMKWARLEGEIKPLKDKLVLDVGCGNGYYCWRMLGKKAKYVVGIDPSLLFYSQFMAIKKYSPNCNIDFIPFGIESLPDKGLYFDTVFSMGVIYHRREPIEHLRQLSKCLKSGGEIIIESLVIDSDNLDVLIPKERYAKMKNVWSIPSVKLLVKWINDAGFKNIKIINTTQTTIKEQRITEWMKFESLANFLNQHDINKTIEGYPAPVRTIVISEKP